jgi:hypothetical protein
MPFKFLRRLKRKPPPNLWHFALDARDVMATRISRGLTGRLSADEARRMVVEKQAAAARAHLAYMQWLFDGNVAAANDAVFNIYHGAVKSNRKRLARRRWGWPLGWRSGTSLLMPFVGGEPTKAARRPDIRLVPLESRKPSHRAGTRRGIRQDSVLTVSVPEEGSWEAACPGIPAARALSL